LGHGWARAIPVAGLQLLSRRGYLPARLRPDQ
jgi:hypothetical protein